MYLCGVKNDKYVNFGGSVSGTDTSIVANAKREFEEETAKAVPELYALDWAITSVYAKASEPKNQDRLVLQKYLDNEVWVKFPFRYLVYYVQLGAQFDLKALASKITSNILQQLDAELQNCVAVHLETNVQSFEVFKSFSSHAVKKY